MPGFQKQNIDLGAIFDPLRTQTKRANVNYLVNGVDISNSYAPVNVGTAGTSVNMLANGSDIGNMFAKIGSVEYPGGLYVWGNGNDYGSFGLSSTLNMSTPVQIGALANWKQVSVAGQFSTFTASMAVKSDGTLWGCGYNESGNIGIGDIISLSSPVQVGSLTTWKQVSTSMGQQASTLAVKTDGTLWAWGNNGSGELGLNNIVKYSSPVQVGSLTTWKQVSTAVIGASGFSAAIKTDGTLWTWGKNTYGQLGYLTTVLGMYAASTPVQVGTLPDWANVNISDSDIGSQTVYYIKNNSTLWKFGANGSYSSPVQVGTRTDWARVSTGNFANGLVDTSGRLWVWGGNSRGQLGLGTVVSSGTDISPVQVGLLTNWKAASYGDQVGSTAAGIAVKTDGTLWAIGGNNDRGSLGLVDIISRSSPVQIGSLTNWKQISLSKINQYISSLAVKTDGTLWAWGDNTGGKLGLLDAAHRSSPVQVGSLTNWAMVRAGLGSTIAVKTDGTLWTWGSNSSGILGLGNVTSVSSPVQVGVLTTWKHATVTDYGAAAVKTDGTLWTWGYNADYRLGLGDATNRSSPTQVGTATNWAYVFASHTGNNGFMTGVKTDGTLWSFGSNQFGNLGTLVYNDVLVDVSSPVQVGTSTNWAQVSTGGESTAAVKTDGTLWTWGSNASNSLGLGDAGHRSSPTQVGSLTNWRRIELGVAGKTASGLKGDGSLWTWGYNAGGALGLGDITNRNSPVQVGGMFNWRNVASGSVGSGAEGVMVATKTDGTLWGWGYGSGAYGSDIPQKYVAPVSTPVQVGALTDWSDIASCEAFCLGVKTNGTLWSWGRNNSGQLGLGDSVNVSSPVQVGTLSNWSKVYACSNQAAVAFAIKTDGTLWSWGAGGGFVLGLGNATNRSSPVQVGTSTNWKEVDCAANWSSQGHTAAIKTDGTLWTWGTNAQGGLGQGNIVAVSTPVQVGALTNWNKVECGTGSTFGVKTTGELWVWGRNEASLLGLGDTTSYSSPIQLGVLTNWKNISSTDSSLGYEFTTAIKTDGTLWSWGNNGNGRLGLGDTTNRNSPVQVGGLTTWSYINSGSNANGGLGGQTYAIKTDGTLWTWGTSGVTGNLGLGEAADTTFSKSSPVKIGSATNWRKACVGAGSGTWLPTAAAVTTTNTLWTWGDNTYGQLGFLSNRVLTYYSSPVQIGSQTDWNTVSAASSSTQEIIVAATKF